MISLFLKPYALASSKLLCLQPWRETGQTHLSNSQSVCVCTVCVLVCGSVCVSVWKCVCCVSVLTWSSRRQQKGAFCSNRWQSVGELPMYGELGGYPFTYLATQYIQFNITSNKIMVSNNHPFTPVFLYRYTFICILYITIHRGAL